ncbi:MAG: hypothetical protein JSV32_08315 [Dehalococcoidia bacterium]|nr:MAG: hypothetical protein JSV32_08315 [Dehalococcoidia bacterium]
MMKRADIIILAFILIAISTLAYYVHYIVFRDPHHIFIFMVGDLAFVFLEVFLVVLVIERILTRREKQSMFNKLNMVAGAFFSEVGNKLLAMLITCYNQRDKICPCLNVSNDWTSNDYKKALDFINTMVDKPQCSNIDLDALKGFLVHKRSFILRLLENPNVLEHERGSNLLWAVLHLTDELEARESLGDLPKTDLDYLASSIQRVYRLLAVEWINYMKYLKTDHPFLFSLILRTHPFQEKPSPVILRNNT